MKSNLVEIHQLQSRFFGVQKDRDAIQTKIEQFQTAGKGYYLQGTIVQFGKIRGLLEAMIEQADSELNNISKKIELLK